MRRALIGPAPAMAHAAGPLRAMTTNAVVTVRPRRAAVSTKSTDPSQLGG